MEDDETMQDQQLRMAAEVGQMLLAQNAELKKAAADGASELQATETRATRAEERQRLVERRCESLEAELRGLEESRAKAGEDRGELNQKFKAAKAELAERGNDKSRLIEENDRLCAELAKAAERERALEAKVHSAMDRLQESDRCAQPVIERRDFLERKCSVLERRSESLKEQLADSKLQLKQMCDETGKEQSLQDLMASPGVAKVAAPGRAARARAGAGQPDPGEVSARGDSPAAAGGAGGAQEATPG